ncbi:MAG: hypothetical protein K9L61_03445 [Candidatus Omnitrophica bacterium]|nr:hypothetical protein [Candidatus Omnitrophota bacterium]
MEALVKLIGIILVAKGAIFLANVSLMKKMIKFWLASNHIYFGGLLSIVIGVLFLISASSCRAFWLVILIGIISTIKGILIFTPFRFRMISFARKNAEGQNSKLRLLATITLAIGVLIIYAA